MLLTFVGATGNVCWKVAEQDSVATADLFVKQFYVYKETYCAAVFSWVCVVRLAS
jgi:hypothetical protein